MSDNEYWYKYYRQKYYDSCYEINNCNNRIYNLKNQRPQKVNTINKLNVDINNTQTALENLEEILKSETSFNTKLVAVENKTRDASVNFTGMVNSSNVKSKNLSEIYSEETTQTKNKLNNILSIFKTKKYNLSTRLNELRSNLSRANSDLQGIDSGIRKANSDISYWKQQKNSNNYNMEYYRRKMMQEV